MSIWNTYPNVTTLTSADEFAVWQSGALKNITFANLASEILDEKTDNAVWYAEVSATSGTVSAPAGGTLVEDRFSSGVSALCSTITTLSPPDDEAATEADGTPVLVTTFTAGTGAYVLSGTPSSWPVALIFAYTIPSGDYSNTKDLFPVFIDDDTTSPEGTDVLSTGEAGAVKFLREDGDGTCSWQTPAGAGDVTAAAVMTDNTLVKADGGAKGVQDSGITIDDSDRVLGAGTLVENVAGAFSAFDLTDIGRTFVATGTTATWTFPANASIAYPIGTPINGINKGSGLLTIALTTDTLDSAGSLVDVSVGAAFTMIKTAATAWTLAGGLE